MKLSSFIARRYFFAKSSSNAVNIITGISVLGILVGTAALIIVLSAFNGLEDLVRGFYNDFDPDLKVSPASGKFFDQEQMQALNLQSESIAGYSYVLEEKALLTFRNREYIATLKGVDDNYARINQVSSHVKVGRYHLGDDLSVTPAVIGSGVAYYLGISESGLEQPVQVFMPSEGKGLRPSGSFKTENIYPVGVFAIQPDFDEKYVLLPLQFVRGLLGRPAAVSALEISIHDYDKIEQVQRKLQEQLGPEFEIKNRDEQQAVFFKVMKTEGLFTFLVFALILGIATFTVAGSLTMLIFEKRQNLSTLHAMGMNLHDLRQIFFKEGMVISLSGGCIGLLLGVGIVLAQHYFSIITVGQGYVIEGYPVKLKLSDLLLVAATVFSLSAAISWLTARRLNSKILRI